METPDSEITEVPEEEAPLTVVDNEEETSDSELIDIQDEEVPLAVLDDEEESTDSETTDIQDEEVPLAVSVPAAAERLWWSWIPVLGPIISAVEGYRRNRQAKETPDDDKKEE